MGSRNEPFRRFDNRPPPTPRKRMLAQGRKAHFLYDLRALLSTTKLDGNQHRAFAESLFARGSRGSTEEAKAWLAEKVQDQTLSKAEAQAIADLVERYSFWR